jgi:FkbM family methyltransferase
VNLARALNKPYYFFRPAQLLRRFARAVRPRDTSERETMQLPWGLDINVQPAEAIGSSIARTGVFELPVSETIWRLLDAGDLAVDVGANIGYMTSLMTAKVGPSGRVVALEPHPELFRRLSDNASRWMKNVSCGEPELHDFAASDRAGDGTLYTGTEFEGNMGTATLRPPEDSGVGSTESLRVTTITLDTMLKGSGDVGLLKVDVEGHELSVFMGARELLSQGRVRDVIFEELRQLPTPVSELLDSCGYELFAVEQRFWGVAVKAAGRTAGSLWDAPTYLATNRPDRVRTRLKANGWNVLRSQRRVRT